MCCRESLSQVPCLLTHQKGFSMWFQASWFTYFLVELNKAFPTLKNSGNSFSCNHDPFLCNSCFPLSRTNSLWELVCRYLKKTCFGLRKKIETNKNIISLVSFNQSWLKIDVFLIKYENRKSVGCTKERPVDFIKCDLLDAKKVNLHQVSRQTNS